ncbi:hypothetical protein, partial [Staphylococcus pseudintermedius]|uniref:hypothetical protein n=1 Tax=Staphylococcus pseudintermedius TaxID=283734 RepID=UPI001CA3D14D
DSTAFLLKEPNKYGPDFCVCRLGRHNFSVPARHHAFTITSLARTSPDGFSANAASVLQNRQ